MEKFEAKTLSKCKNCSALSRPNILMFGDWDWNPSRANAQNTRFNNWLRSVKKKRQKLSILEIGAGTAIATVRVKGEGIALSYENAKLIRINPRDYDIDKNIGWSIPCGGLQGLKEVL